MAGERRARRRQVPDAVAVVGPRVVGGLHERRLRQPRLAREGQHRRVVEPSASMHHGELVAGQRRSVKTSSQVKRRSVNRRSRSRAAASARTRDGRARASPAGTRASPPARPRPPGAAGAAAGGGLGGRGRASAAGGGSAAACWASKATVGGPAGSASKAAGGRGLGRGLSAAGGGSGTGGASGAGSARGAGGAGAGSGSCQLAVRRRGSCGRATARPTACVVRPGTARATRGGLLRVLGLAHAAGPSASCSRRASSPGSAPWRA